MAVYAAEPLLSQTEAELLKTMEKLPPAQAVIQLQKAITPESSPALLFTLGAFFVKAGDKHAAQKAFMDAVHAYPDFHRARLNAAKLMIEAEDFPGAAKNLIYLISKPDSENTGILWLLLSQCHLRNNNPIAAEAAAKNAVALCPDDKNARLLLLQALANQNGRLSEAASVARQELLHNHQDPRLWSLWASAELENDNQLKALTILETARRFKAADSSMLATLLDLCISHERFKQATELAVFLLKDGKLSANQFSAAVNAIQDADIPEFSRKILSAAPETYLSNTVLARQAAIEGNPQQAEKIWRDTLSRNPLDGEALLSLASLLRNKGDYNQAADLLDRAEMLPSFKFRALLSHAQNAVASGNLRHALTFAVKAQQLQNSPELEDYIRQIKDSL